MGGRGGEGPDVHALNYQVYCINVLFHEMFGGETCPGFPPPDKTLYMYRIVREKMNFELYIISCLPIRYSNLEHFNLPVPLWRVLSDYFSWDLSPASLHHL